MMKRFLELDKMFVFSCLLAGFALGQHYAYVAYITLICGIIIGYKFKYFSQSVDSASQAPVKPPAPINGAKAYELGYKMEDNPYSKHTAEHSIWRDDWLFAAGRFK